MRIKDGFVLRDVAGQAVVIATGEASRSFHGMVKLNSTGKLIWEGIAQGRSEQEIADSLVAAYEVAPEQAQADVAAFAARMQEAGFLAE